MVAYHSHLHLDAELGKQKYILLPSAGTIHLISCSQGGGNSPLPFNLPLPQNLYKCCPWHSVWPDFAGADSGKVPLGNGPPSTLQHPSSPDPSVAPSSCFHCSLCHKGPCSSRFTSLFPSCPSTSFKHIDPASVYLVLCSICCSNIKHEKSQSAWAKAKMLFKVWYCCRVLLHYQSEIKARCF